VIYRITRSAVGLVTLMLLLVPSILFAYGFLDALNGGTALPGIHPNSLGLGGARAVGFGDAASIFLNPADIYRIPGSSYTVAVGGAVARELVTDSLGKRRSDQIAFGNALVAFKLQPSPSLAVGAGLARITDASYSAIVYIYETEPPDIGRIIADTSAESSGSLWEAAGCVAYRLAPWLNAGLSAGMRFGGSDMDFEFIDRENHDNDSTWTESWEESVFCWHAGVIFPLELTSIGISYASGSDYYSDRIAVGGVFYTDASNQGAIGIEGELVSISDEPEFTARIFGRFSPEGAIRFRGGLFFTDKGDSQTSSVLGFSVGTSIAFGRFSLDGAFSTSTAKYEGSSFGYEYIEDLKNNNSIFSIGLSLNP
jgi:hypothetical protein